MLGPPHSYQLAAVNPGIDARCDNLTPGEVLCLGYVGSDCTTTHVVTADQTCDGVAQTYSMNTTVLYQNNPQLDVDCNNMYIGEVRIHLLVLPRSPFDRDFRTGPVCCRRWLRCSPRFVYRQFDCHCQRDCHCLLECRRRIRDLGGLWFPLHR